MDILVVGFCFGGWIANMMAVKIPELCAVPYYGGQPTAEEAEQINANHGSLCRFLDSQVNEGWPAFEAILKKNKVDIPPISILK
jgi:carboxymethylenebutenolidase